MTQSPDWINAPRLYLATRDALGRSVEDPIAAFLGYLDENGAQQIDILNPAPDQVGKLYYTIAYSEDLTEAIGVGTAYNTGLGAIADDQKIFGAPIYLKHDPQSDDWYIAGTRARANAQFVGSQPPRDPLPGAIVPKTGLLDETNPQSMRAIVYGSSYTLNSALKWINTLYTPDFTANIPATDGKALYVLVQVDFANEVLDCTHLGAEFDAALLPSQVWASDEGSGVYLPQPDANKFCAGFIRLVSGMTVITRSLIWALQEIFTKTNLSSLNYSNILVDEFSGEVVTCDGEVVYIE